MGIREAGYFLLIGPTGDLPERRAYAWVRKFEEALIVLILFLLMRALIAVIFIPRHLPLALRMEYVDPRLRMFTATAYLLLLGLVVVFHRQMLQALRKDPWLLLFLAWLFLSLFWSVQREVTLRRFVSLAASIACGIYLGARFRMAEQLRLVMVLLGIAGLLSLLMGLLMPDLARYTEPRGEVWSGIFVQKNSLGQSMALATVLAVYGREVARRWRMVLLVISVPLLILAQSRTAQTSTVIMILLLPYLDALRRSTATVRGVLLSASALVFSLIGFAIVRHWKEILLWMGRDPSLTGRTLIWGLVWQAIQKRFWMGYGFKAFWSGRGEAVVEVWRHFTGEWIPTHAHNGILELWLHAGVIGVLLWLVVYARNLALALRTPNQIWPLGFLVLLGVYSIAEPTVAVPDGVGVLFWILFIALSYRLRMERERAS